MDFKSLIVKWSNLSSKATTIIVTDSDRLSFGMEMKTQIPNCRIINIEEKEDYLFELFELKPSDLVIALFSFNTFVFKGANRHFSPFDKPEGIMAKYIFIRLSISKGSLVEGLSTPKELVYDIIDKLHSYLDRSKLHVTNASGTDIVLDIHPFGTCDHEIKEDGGMAFLPPSETSSEVIPLTANGKIVVDVTVGQLYHYGEFLGQFGLVDNPVSLIVESGVIVDICGGKMAAELKENIFALAPECRILVELGHGLSKMTPTGFIGVDESIVDTCHFGIGDGAVCGVHLDVVVSKPTIQLVH